MSIALDREMCRDAQESITREWLITNDLGSYAAGTVAGALTRPQHGLLVSRVEGRDEPHVLVNKIDEEVVFDQRNYYLGTNEYHNGTLLPAGFVHLEEFRLEHGMPVFNYHLGGRTGIQLEKRIWMVAGQNTTCIQYKIVNTTSAEEGYRYRTQGDGDKASQLEAAETSKSQRITLTLLPFVTYRPFHTLLPDSKHLHFYIETYHEKKSMLPEGVAGCTLKASAEAASYSIFIKGPEREESLFLPTGVWYGNIQYRHADQENLPACGAFYLPGVIRTSLQSGKGETLTVLISTEEPDKLPLHTEQLQQAYQKIFTVPEESNSFPQNPLPILPITSSSDPEKKGREFLELLLRASAKFVSYRACKVEDKSIQHSAKVPIVYTSYFQLETTTREILQALPGLFLVRGLYREAREQLQEIAKHFRNGLLPEHLPTPGQQASESDYTNADCALWYFYALDHYLHRSWDKQLLENLYPLLEDIIHHYQVGTNAGIQVDSDDGLLFVISSGKALTWMNEQINEQPVTERTGKPVEINALWQQSLYLMDHWTQQNMYPGHFGQRTSFYRDMLVQCQQSFQKKFWNVSGRYFYDVVDGPQGNDAALRPNQLLTLVLPSFQIEESKRLDILERVTEHLLTPYGLRTLSPCDPAYKGEKSQSKEERQRARHQGSIWSWWIGPYIEALLAQHQPWSENSSPKDKKLRKEYLWRKGLHLLEPFCQHLENENGLLGMCGSVYSGNYPHQIGEEVASALSIAEILRAYNLLAQMRVEQAELLLFR